MERGPLPKGLTESLGSGRLGCSSPGTSSARELGCQGTLGIYSGFGYQAEISCIWGLCRGLSEVRVNAPLAVPA